MFRDSRGLQTLRALALAGAATFAVAPAFETAGATNLQHGGKGYFMIGWTGLELDDLNRSLNAQGYPGFAKDYLTIGGGGHAVIGRLVLGGHGHAYLGSDESVNLGGINYNTSLDGGAGFFDMGVLAWTHHAFSVTPMVGLGGGGYEIEINERSAPTFDDVLRDPGRSARVSNGAFLIDTSAQFDFIITGDRHHHRGRGGILVGIRAGWVFAPWVGNWQLDNTEIAGGPDVAPTGPYVRFLLGGGGTEDEWDYDD